jgi:hypothetical protein
MIQRIRVLSIITAATRSFVYHIAHKNIELSHVT